jgi:hypothetical protein
MDKERVRALVHGLKAALGKAEYAAFKADPLSAYPSTKIVHGSSALLDFGQ